jgi:hypothetical protein
MRLLNLYAAGAAKAIAAIAPVTTPAHSEPRRHAVPGGDVNGPAPSECMRWPYPSSCLIQGVHWKPNAQQIELLRGGSPAGACWMYLDAKACHYMEQHPHELPAGPCGAGGPCPR